MKKLLILILGIFLLPSIFSISLSSAQDTAKEYMQASEFLDSSFYYINCDSNEFFIISIIDGKENLSLLIPIDSQNGTVIYQSNDKTKNIIKTSYLIRAIKNKNSSSNNYLSLQLLDKIDNLVTLLKSKNAKLDGVVKANYSANINSKINDSKKKLEKLISQLETLHLNLSKLLKEQSIFLDTCNCKDTDSLLYSYKTSFSGYNTLTSMTLDYKDSATGIIEAVVADINLDETVKRTILSYTEVPSNLSSEINSISDWLSSTNQLFQDLVLEFEKTGPNSTIELLTTKINAREDYFLAKSKLYNYDSELKDSLNNSISQILNENNISLWSDAKTVTELNQNYNQILELYNKGKYKEVIPKLTTAKNQVKKIKTEGFIEYTQEMDYTYFIFAGSGLLLLLLIIFLFKKFSKIKKKPKQKPINQDFLQNRRDPFR